MKNFLHAAFLLCLTFQVLLPVNLQAQTTLAKEAGITIYGSYLYSESSEMHWGIYSFPTRESISFTPVWINGDLMATGGAVYANGKYYIVSYLDMGFMSYGLLLACDIDKQEINPIEIENWDYSCLSTDLTYDPSSGKIYACSLDASGDGTFNLSTLNTETGRQTPIAPIIQMCALASDKQGILYGIGQSDGMLYKIDKSTAQLTPIGMTGVQPSANMQSAAFDPSSGTLYWSAYTSDGGALYSVDIQTGSASLISTYPDKTEIVGIFIKDHATEIQPPLPPTEVQVTFDKAELNGQARLTIPTSDVSGNPLKSDIKYTISVLDKNLASGIAAPGSQVTTPIQVDNDGLYEFSFVVQNEGGTSMAAKYETFAGNDAPQAVLELQAQSETKEIVRLEWQHTGKGAHGGYVDTQNLEYDVLRLPDDITVASDLHATSFTDHVASEQIRAVYYKVIPHANGIKGAATQSVPVRVGQHKLIPYDEQFESWTDFALYDVIDANNDDASWIYEGEGKPVKYEWAFNPTNDDWVVTPPLYLETGKYYRATATLHSEKDIYAGTIGFYIGDQPIPSSLDRSMGTPVDVTSGTPTDHQTSHFSVEADGDYYIGLHVAGKRSIYYLYLDRLFIEEVQPTAIPSTKERPRQFSGTALDGTLSITNDTGCTASVYAADGRPIRSCDLQHFCIKLAPGIYIVKAGGQSFKIRL